MSRQQRLIVWLIADGHDTAGIARELGLGKWTVRDYIRGLRLRYGCSMLDLPRVTGVGQQR